VLPPLLLLLLLLLLLPSEGAGKPHRAFRHSHPKAEMIIRTDTMKQRFVLIWPGHLRGHGEGGVVGAELLIQALGAPNGVYPATGRLQSNPPSRELTATRRLQTFAPTG
jgi:hypothetical protein